MTEVIKYTEIIQYINLDKWDIIKKKFNNNDNINF
jgi:hypothetical protein